MHSDVNECATNNGGCDSKRACTNTVGSMSCGDCPAGYTNDGAKGCKGSCVCARACAGGCLPSYVRMDAWGLFVLGMIRTRFRSQQRHLHSFVMMWDGNCCIRICAMIFSNGCMGPVRLGNDSYAFQSQQYYLNSFMIRWDGNCCCCEQ